MIAKENFLEKYNITEELLLSAEISWEELCDIYEDFGKNKVTKYEDILGEFTNTYLKEGSKAKIHSIRSRVKDPEHLIAKIIRKKQDNQKKYKNLSKTNYEKFITDLIGIRCLVLFKEDWVDFHNYIISKFENNIEYYIKDSILDFDNDETHYYIAEMPKAHIRNGDARDIFEKLLPPDCIMDGKVYRSVHYIIKYKGVYLEIQVRTLFEEGWGEVDHAIVYPYFQDDQILKKYTELLNRLSGLADEMSSFFYLLKALEIEHLKQSGLTNDTTSTITYKDSGFEIPDSQEKKQNEDRPLNTPNDYLKSVLEE